MSSRTLELPGSLAVVHPPASAGLAVRLAATAIDGVIVASVALVAGLVAHMALAIFGPRAAEAETWGLVALAAVVVTGYFVYFWGLEGATPGKKIMGLRVARVGRIEDGQAIGMGRALLRLVGITAGNVLLIDSIVALLHRDRRALHDLIADSIVVEAR